MSEEGKPQLKDQANYQILIYLETLNVENKTL